MCARHTLVPIYDWEPINASQNAQDDGTDSGDGDWNETNKTEVNVIYSV
jgi:hypothetical protein